MSRRAKQRHGTARQGNSWQQRHLTVAEMSASRTKGTYLAAEYRRTAGRRGKLQARKVVDHSLLVGVWHILAAGVAWLNGTERSSSMYHQFVEMRPRAHPFDAATFDQLHAFFVVAQNEHVTQAAQILSLSQPALSHKLKELAAALGLELFERIGRGIQLTADGRALFPAVAALMKAHREVDEIVALQRGLLKGDLTLAASNTVGIYRLPAWISGFLRDYPDIHIRVQLQNTQNAIQLLREGEVDCALVSAPARTDRLEELILESDELAVVVSCNHPLARLGRQLEPKDFQGYCYIAREPNLGTEELVSQLLGCSFHSSWVLELAQIDAVRNAVLADLGYAVLPLAVVRNDVDTGKIKQLQVGGPPVVWTLRALRRLSSHGLATLAFWSHLSGLSISDNVELLSEVTH